MPTSRAELAAAYRDLYPAVLKLCLSVTGNRALAEEAAQETFLAALGGLGGFRGEAKLSTWLYRIALRAALRSQARGARGAESVEEVAAQEFGATLEARDEARRLLSAMQQLPVEQRAVLSLFAVEGMKHPEIAAVLGIPEGTVWSRLHVARKRLAELMPGRA